MLRRRLFLYVLCFAFASAENLTAGDYEMGFHGATRIYSNSCSTGDPISAANGAYHFSMPLLGLRGPLELSFQLFYRSDIFRVNQFLPDKFWWSPFARARSGFEIDNIPYATVYLPNGDQISFKRQEGKWVLTDPAVDVGGYTYVDNRPATKYQLKETDDYLYLLDPKAQTIRVFAKLLASGGQHEARILYVIDRNGNRLTFTYNPLGQPTRIDDGLGRYLEITYEAPCAFCPAFVKTVTDQSGRRVVLTAEDRGADNDNRWTLRSVTDPSGGLTTFQYAGRVGPYVNLIKGVTRPLGNTPFTQEYSIQTLNGQSFVRVSRQEDALGHSTQLTYDPEVNKIVVQNPNGASEEFEHYSTHGHPKSVANSSGVAAFSKNDDGQLTALSDRLGNTTGFAYHAESGKLASVTNALDKTLTLEYTAQEQPFINPDNEETVSFVFYDLTRLTYPDGTTESFIYDGKGNTRSYVDQAGMTWTYTHNSRGQVASLTNPKGGVISHTYNDDGTLASTTDSDIGIATTFEYDTAKRLIRITHPDESTVQIVYDANDRIISETDELGNTETYTYDANGNLISHIDQAGKATQYAFDALDRVERITDSDGKSSTLTFDPVWNVVSATDPNGNTTAYSYDTNGRRTEEVDAEGKVWQKQYDVEAAFLGEVTPLGHTTRFDRDALGNIIKVTDPLGNITLFERDALSRITLTTDPLQRNVSFTYDERGLLAGITEPCTGLVSLTRDDLGGLSTMTDPSGNTWRFSSTPMGRLSIFGDPLGREIRHTFDSRGRISQTLFPGGETRNLTHDAAGNISREVYSDGTDQQYAYDVGGRLISATGFTVSRNSAGNVVRTEANGIDFEASYDGGGRLETVSYNNGAFTVTYGYDRRNLLMSAADDLTNSRVDLTYDDDGRLIGVSRSNGLLTTYAWDAASRLVRIQEGNFLDLQYAYDAAGQLTEVSGTLPLDPASALTEGRDELSYDAAYQVSSSGYSYDARGRVSATPRHTFAWNGASYLVGIDDITLTYDGLARPTTRSEGGTTRRFYHHDAIASGPLVAEQAADSGAFLTYYIWTPDGRLLYSINAADGNRVCFYHFDHLGSTLALTDAAGSLTDSYAYAPYGRLLGHEGANTQPFTFLGQWGVRQEDAGTLYRMGMRYYDAVAARFLSKDPAWPAVTSAKSINPYLYALANPLRYVDPQGDNPIGVLIKKMLKSGSKELAKKTARELAAELSKKMAKKMAKKLGEKAAGEAVERIVSATSSLVESWYNSVEAVKDSSWTYTVQDWTTGNQTFDIWEQEITVLATVMAGCDSLDEMIERLQKIRGEGYITSNVQCLAEEALQKLRGVKAEIDVMVRQEEQRASMQNAVQGWLCYMERNNLQSVDELLQKQPYLKNWEEQLQLIREEWGKRHSAASR